MPKLFDVKFLIVCGLLAAGFVIGVSTKQAEARPDYYKAWVKQYPAVAKANSVDKEVKCAVCHDASTNRKIRNPYGQAIAKALNGKKNLKISNNNKAILAAFAKAADAKSETPDKTFGDLLDAKSLPAKGK